MTVVTVDIINEKALNLLEDMEDMQLIRLHKDVSGSRVTNWAEKFKGQMTKQSINEIENQLNELRRGWE